ncbi:hypothetical protein [Devosia ginsengisoli]|uniref:Uncharacterized protein n=1 Tax=Devosia ginsengisoli TaxID=400770 RepID=A0A5B8LQT3_9HYPH|nr:hypothetical protein [Devosia ginsengisoli]QDZ10513.1 hypothetical protein FPZ08_06970 [Devosia ginsengisoli]
MAPIIRASRVVDAAAIYEPAPGAIDPEDPFDPMHRPLVDPENWLANISFHSEFDYCEVAFGPDVVAVNHAAIAAATPSGGFSVESGQVVFDTTVTTHTLAVHNLGYVPDFMVVVDGDALYPGYIAQFYGDGRARYLCAYATTTHLCLEVRASRTANAIPAISKNYTVLIFKQPPAPSGDILARWDPDDAVLHLGRDKFRSDRRYLQVGSNGDPFGFALGRTIHLKNGAPRFVDADGTITDPVPAAARWAFASSWQTSGWTFGPSAAYNGTFTGGPAIQVRAP